MRLVAAAARPALAASLDIPVCGFAAGACTRPAPVWGFGLLTIEDTVAAAVCAWAAVFRNVVPPVCALVVVVDSLAVEVSVLAEAVVCSRPTPV